MDSNIYRLHFVKTSNKLKIYISLYRVSSNVGITENNKSLRTGENHFVVCGMLPICDFVNLFCAVSFFTLIQQIF